MNQQKTEVTNIQINSYDSNGVSVQGNYTRFPCVIFKTTIKTDVLPANFELFNENYLNALNLMGPEIIIIGTGLRQRFPRPGLINTGRSLEFMDSGSACRVFNVLTMEDRSVLVALFR